jgi:hypothetical protein
MSWNYSNIKVTSFWLTGVWFPAGNDFSLYHCVPHGFLSSGYWWAFSPWINHPEYEADCSPLSGTKVMWWLDTRTVYFPFTITISFLLIFYWLLLLFCENTPAMWRTVSLKIWIIIHIGRFLKLFSVGITLLLFLLHNYKARFSEGLWQLICNIAVMLDSVQWLSCT